jgi:hypothetical protein
VSLEDRLEAGLPSAWRPDQDDPDLLVGEVIEIEVGSSEYGHYPIIVIRKEDGEEKAVHGFHTVLRNELMKHKPNVGERVGIKYLGDVETKPGSKFKSFKGYRVKVEREKAATFNWSSFGESASEEQIHNAYNPGAYEPAAVTVPEGAGDDDIPF